MSDRPWLTRNLKITQRRLVPAGRGVRAAVPADADPAHHRARRTGRGGGGRRGCGRRRRGAHQVRVRTAGRSPPQGAAGRPRLRAGGAGQAVRGGGGCLAGGPRRALCRPAGEGHPGHPAGRAPGRRHPGRCRGAGPSASTARPTPREPWSDRCSPWRRSRCWTATSGLVLWVALVPAVMSALLVFALREPHAARRPGASTRRRGRHPRRFRRPSGGSSGCSRCSAWSTSRTRCCCSGCTRSGSRCRW